MSHYPTRHPYMRKDFLVCGEGQFWLGRESSYTPATLEYFRKLLEADRIEYERREKVSYKKMSN